MTADELPVRDPIDLEREQPELTADLRRLMADFDASSDDFAAGVRERIERGSQGDAVLPGGELLSVGLRRAAAVLPPFLLPKGLAKLGVGGGGALLAKGGGVLGKGGFAGLAILPAVTGLMLLVSLFVVVRSLFLPADPERQGQDRVWAQEAVQQFWRENLVATVLTMAALIALLFVAPVEAVTLTLIVSTLALCLIFARLARSGLASRYEIGVRAGSLAMITVGYGWSFTQRDWLRSGDAEGAQLVMPLLWLGGLICLIMARAGTQARRRRALNIQIGCLAGIALVGVLVGLFFGYPHPATRSDYDAWMTAPRGILTGDIPWEDVAQAQRLQALAGEPLVDPSVLRDLARRDISERFLRGARDMLPLLSLDLVDRDVVATWHHEQELQQRLGRARWSRPNEDFLYQVARELGRLSADDRDAAAAKLLRTLPEPDEHDALENLVLAARTLEALGRARDVGMLTARAHATLKTDWLCVLDEGRGAFWPSPKLIASSAERHGGEPWLGSTWVESTAAGVEAMARWGVPHGIDLFALERYLEGEIQIDEAEDVLAHEALAYAGLLALRALPEYGDAVATRGGRSPWELAWVWRMPVAALLLVLLSVVATWRAPVRQVEDDDSESLDWVDWWQGVRFRSKTGD